jgi:hypothetical protein
MLLHQFLPTDAIDALFHDSYPDVTAQSSACNRQELRRLPTSAAPAILWDSGVPRQQR